MATKKEKYESMRIMSLEGSVLYKNEGFTALKNGKPNPGAFRGVLDESLDTLKLAEIYERHEDEIGYPYRVYVGIDTHDMRFRRRNHIESNVDLDSRIPSRQGNACVGTYDNARASFRTLSA